MIFKFSNRTIQLKKFKDLNSQFTSLKIKMTQANKLISLGRDFTPPFINCFVQSY